MKDPLAVCDLLADSECQVMVTGEAEDCLWLQMTEDDGAWYVEVYPNGIAYTVWETFEETAFDLWFKAEYGKRPSRKSIDDLTTILISSRDAREFTKASNMKQAAVDWDMRREAAHKAWSASRDQKGSK